MDADRFDALAKLLGANASRRHALSGALVGILAITPGEAGDRRNRRNRNKKPKQATRQRQPASRATGKRNSKKGGPNGRQRRKQQGRDHRPPRGKDQPDSRQEREAASQALAATPGLPEIDYFALGDSIASGHGLQDTGTSCRRSVMSYPHKVLDLLSADYQVTFHHLACSGATARQSLPGQVDEALRIIEQRNETPANQGRPTLVSITIGANDLEWADPLKLVDRMIFKTDAQYVDFVDQRVEGVAKIITLVIQRLLSVEGVRVVLTDVHNPFNNEPGPWFTRLARQFWPRDPQVFLFGSSLRCSVLECVPGLPCGAMDCADRAELAVTRLGNALSGVMSRLNENEQSRMQFAHAAFAAGQNEAPQDMCGTAPPNTDQTWIQYPWDPNSNSNPSWDIKVGRLTRKVGWPGGDCFHPNEKGATAYADAVYADAVRLGFDCGDGHCNPPTTCSESQPCPAGYLCDGGACVQCNVCVSGCAFTSVQQAVDAASSGDTITLCPGTYLGANGRVVIDKNLTIVGAGDGEDPANNTILDADENGRVVRVAEEVTVALRGLRITRGLPPGMNGAGILSLGNLSLTACTVTRNQGGGARGGGIIQFGEGTFTLDTCVVTFNDAHTGGGLSLESTGAAFITNCTITNNRAFNGGGIAATNVTIENSTITENSAFESGGGIYTTGTVTLIGATVSGNESGTPPNNCAGGGTYAGEGCSPG